MFPVGEKRFRFMGIPRVFFGIYLIKIPQKCRFKRSTWAVPRKIPMTYLIDF